MLRLKHKTNENSQSGMSLIELLFAGFILVVGMMGSLTLITMAIMSNTRNKTDTTGTMLAQLVIEQMNSFPTTSPVSQINITDCATTSHTTASTWTLSMVGGASGTGAGANLVTTTSDPNYKRIDFTQAYSGVPTNYKMLYYTCGDITYDVRWNIQTFTKSTRIVTVSARQSGATNQNVLIFAPPVTLRTVQGP